MKRMDKIIASVLSVFSLAICCGCTTGYDYTWVNRRTNATYTYNGEEFRTHTIQYNGSAYMKMPQMTEIDQFTIICPFDEYQGDDGHSYHIYTSSKDPEKNFLCSPYGNAGKENPPKNFFTGYVQVGYQFPNIYEVELSSASVILEEVNVTQIQSGEEVAATFETPVLLSDIVDKENVVTNFDSRTNAYAIFDIKDNECLRLGEFAICEKAGVLYLRLHAWEEKYYKINDAYQSIYQEICNKA